MNGVIMIPALLLTTRKMKPISALLSLVEAEMMLGVEQ